MTAAEKILYRIMDANYNRAKEALRVAEDIRRFSRLKKNQAKAWKTARHQLTRILLGLPRGYQDLVTCRDVPRDPGRTGTIRDKKGKLKLHDLLFANIQRAQEALRVLEECSKIVNPKSAAAFARLRFHIYDLEKRTAAAI